MGRIEDLQELLGEIDRYGEVAHRLLEAIDQLRTRDLPAIGKTTTAAIAATGLLENSYTAVETVLFRISQTFGNNRHPVGWHSDLLHRMTITVPGLRPAVLSEETRNSLDELMRFRHFKRYYFNLEYDWSRLEYLLDRLVRLVPTVLDELAVFRAFLEQLICGLEEPLTES